MKRNTPDCDNQTPFVGTIKAFGRLFFAQFESKQELRRLFSRPLGLNFSADSQVAGSD